ncbi:MAG: ACP S-malonyltransferase [Proteobacteria bacterium]|nr:ACP S-malonyltransferase [Pseudomonadota bacterium]
MDQAFVFPGQGSQALGMGRELAEAFAAAREVFEEVDEALGQNLSRLMFEGPEEDLILTENAQPALMAVGHAVWRVLEREGGLDMAGACRFVAGHSLGEYSALASAGSIGLADTARLVKTRGRAMQEAVPVGEGAMAALIGVDRATADDIAQEAAGDEVCVVANDNAPDQVVVSGSRAAVERAADIAVERGAKRAIMLPVSAPFHCPLMKPAAEVMAEALAETEMRPPAVPLISNVRARPVTEPETIRADLVAQVTDVVRWRECVLYLKQEGVERIVELGAGRVLTGLARRIDRELEAVSIQGPGDIESFLDGI